jgi:hypothetical protein
VLSGVAAAGAPIIGQVTIKDSNGVLRSVDIKTDGGYSVDVTDMTAPFLLRAAGQVGGREGALVSAATSADLNGTINITPFTDLIVANIAGQITSAYFEKPDFSKLTTQELNTAKTTLTQRLQPILTNLGIADSFDLLRTAFKADHSGFDAVLDVLRVIVDETTGLAKIRDLINNSEITDNLASSTDANALPAPVIGLAGAVGDLLAIENVLKGFNAQFATGLPSPNNPALRSLFVNDGSFLDRGHDLDTFLFAQTTDPTSVGIKLNGVAIIEHIDGSTMRISFQAIDKLGAVDSAEWLVKKVSGIWKLAGDQRSIDQEITAINARNINGVFGTTSTNTQYHRHLNLEIEYAPVDVDSVRVSGPGLTAPVLLHRSTQGEDFVILKTDNSETSGTWLDECGFEPSLERCINFSAVGLNSVYTFTPLDSSGAPIIGKPAFTHTLPAPPLSNAQAESNAASLFGSVTQTTPGSYTSFTDGSTITVTLTLPTAGGAVFDDVQYFYDGNAIGSEILNADGKSVDLTWHGAPPTVAPELHVSTIGQFGRHFRAMGRHN